MSSVYIKDDSGESLGGSSDKDIRKQIKELCKSNSIPCSETSDSEKQVCPTKTEILIVHLGCLAMHSISNIETRLKELKQASQVSQLIIGVSRDPNYITESSEKCKVPAFYYPEIIDLLKKAIVENNETKKGLRLCLEEIITNYKHIRNIIRNLLPLDIDIQALSKMKVTNKIKHLKDMLNNVEKGFYANKFSETKKLISNLSSGSNKNKIDDLFIKDKSIENFLNNLDKMKEKPDSLNEDDAQTVTSCSSNIFPSFLINKLTILLV